jgi:hypothetical protein
MKKIAGHAAALCALALLTTASRAQYPGGQFGRGPTPFSRPTVSPYLNLLQSGNPAINYYGLVRPQFAYDRAIQNLGNNVNALGANVNNLDANQTSQTGHRSSFMTQSQYFMTNGAAGGNTLANQQATRPGANQSGQVGQGSSQGSGQRAPTAPSRGR